MWRRCLKLILKMTIKFCFLQPQSSSWQILIFSAENESKAIFRVKKSYQDAARNVCFRLKTGIPERIFNAWKMGAEHDLIAHASVSDQIIWVLDCALNVLKVPFDALPALRSLPEAERHNFELDSDGSYLYWKFTDTHIELESFKVAVDPVLRAKLNAEKLLYDERFCKAIATFRKELKLKQTDITGVSAKQIGRIEKGARPKLETLKLLAQGHGLEINDYLAKIAQTMSRLK
jgi:Helix-turn-helix